MSSPTYKPMTHPYNWYVFHVGKYTIVPWMVWEILSFWFPALKKNTQSKTTPTAKFEKQFAPERLPKQPNRKGDQSTSSFLSHHGFPGANLVNLGVSGVSQLYKPPQVVNMSCWKLLNRWQLGEFSAFLFEKNDSVVGGRGKISPENIHP